MFNSVRQCLFSAPSGQYTYKKIDQYGDGAIKAWIEAHPLETELWSFSPDQIEKLIESVLRSLPTNQINWGNLETVKTHLGRFADQTECTQQSILHQISNLKIEKDFAQELEKAISKRNPPC